MKRKLYTICILVAGLLGLNVQAQQLERTEEESATEMQRDGFNPDLLQISLITCGPGVEAYELYGHSALRVKYAGDEEFDVVFNYGIFDFNTPHFVWRFSKGETDYCLAAQDYDLFVYEYMCRESRVDEQELNLSPEQKLTLFNALLVNAQPQNREYRYNFLFDNCATRPRDMIERVLGEVQYQEPAGAIPTFREEIHRCAARCPWVIFGIDLALGAELDRPMTYREWMFVPDVLRQAFARATVQGADRQAHPLVLQSTEVYLPDEPAQPDATPFYLTPLFLTWLLCLLVAALSVYDIRRKRCTRWADSLLYMLYGLGGTVIFFLMFCSEHPATSVNYSAVWLHPLWLLVAGAIWFKSLKNIVRYYHFANFAVLLLFLVLWYWIPQQFNAAFLPLVLVLIARSLTYIVVDREQRKLKK